MSSTGLSTDPSRVTRQLRVMLVDDHQLLAHSLAIALQASGVACTVAKLTDRETLLRDVMADRPDLVLLDLDLGQALGDGSALVDPLVRSGCRVLLVSASSDPAQVSRGLEGGAVGIVDKHLPFERMLDVALSAAHGEQVMDAPERLRLIDQSRRDRHRRAEELAPFRRLSACEAEVLRALAVGDSAATIARSRVVSEATVRSQIKAVLTKLGVNSQLAAVATAHRCGWL